MYVINDEIIIDSHFSTTPVETSLGTWSWDESQAWTYRIKICNLLQILGLMDYRTTKFENTPNFYYTIYLIGQIFLTPMNVRQLKQTSIFQNLSTI